MQIHTTDVPAKQAGEHITKLLTEHDGDSLCLLSGGSALDVIEYIKIPDKDECRTIFMMVDERVSGEESVNNYLQLKKRSIGQPLLDMTVNTTAKENEQPENFASRIENDFKKLFSELNDPKIISVLGMGADGHTAGIFPMDQASFSDTYKEDRVYVPVHNKGLTIDSRASFTPTWLLNNVNEIVAYVTGETKYLMLKSLINETKELCERPAELFKLHGNVHLFTDTEV